MPDPGRKFLIRIVALFIAAVIGGKALPSGQEALENADD